MLWHISSYNSSLSSYLSTLVVMKTLIVGASGSIGSQVLLHCLAHPEISSIVAFVRRDLPLDISSHPKLQCVIIKDFLNWPEEILHAHSDAVGMLWNMGTNTGDIRADLEYPLAFIESMGQVLETKSDRPPFKHVHLSGKFVRQDQEEKLCFLEEARKMKGRLETRSLAFAESHATIWKTFIVRPGGVATKGLMIPGIIATILGENWSVRVEELAAFMTYLAIDGQGEDSLIENARIVRKGRNLLEHHKNNVKP
ncbi:uncharacterized protein F4812DRAFT_408725 [Daldinia caldariorum]|uniref:uncharacterized protein n=1 Tax=Daldinia caldariorum TaxID=326644 RepID=UPI002008AADC|nr:uncharacterized protein F4812DRAFT_408725 [Daldinia caldariorum]KAI1472389.1 hypothetical protein F4812DRAFT_408725 [Daldinia caldariorum]